MSRRPVACGRQRGGRRTWGRGLRGVGVRLGRVAGEQRDAALPGAVGHVTGDADVPVLAPQRAPRVLHHPVVRRVLRAGRVGAVANEEDAVVEVLAAALRENTASVQLERPLVGLDGDRDRLRRDRREELLWVLGGNCTLHGCEDGYRGSPRTRGCVPSKLVTKACCAGA